MNSVLIRFRDILFFLYIHYKTFLFRVPTTVCCTVAVLHHHMHLIARFFHWWKRQVIYMKKT